MWLWEENAYIHCPKTGGTFVSSALRDVGARLVHRQHSPARDEDLTGLHAYGNIREPFAWYLSLWIQSINHDRKARERLAVYGDGHTNFFDALHGMTHPEGRTPDQPGVFVGPFGETFTGGLWSWMIRRMYCDEDGAWLVHTLMNTSRLNEAVPAVLGIDVADRAPVNTRHTRLHKIAGPARYSEWLTADAARWIYEADGELMDAFGLTPLGGADAPAWWGMA